MTRIVFCLLGLLLFLASCSKNQTSTPQERLTSHNETLTKAYDTVGRHNPKWDELARKALLEYAKLGAMGGKEGEVIAFVSDPVQEAVNAGCDDLLIRYLYCRFSQDFAARPLAYRQEEFRKVAQGLETSGYSPLLKFYANDRAAVVFWQGRDKALWPEVSHYRRAAMNDLAVAVQDKTLPVEDIVEAGDVLLETISASKQEMAEAYNQLEGPIFQNWPQSSAAYLFKAKYNYRLAWQARGGGVAKDVTPEGWAEFKEKLGVAEEAYKKAWSLNSKDVHVATEMIEMAVSQKKDRKEMELWFQRAMALNADNYEACTKKLRYLKPEWYGSSEEMLAFGHDCVAAEWGGRVPLILVDAHSQITGELERADRAAYWRQPAVWPDIQSAYEKYLQVNKEIGRTRYYYASFAFRCGQWQEFNNQLKLIRDDRGTVDADFFGGQDALNKMIEYASGGDAKN